MDERDIRQLLDAVRAGRLSTAQGVERVEKDELFRRSDGES